MSVKKRVKRILKLKNKKTLTSMLAVGVFEILQIIFYRFLYPIRKFGIGAEGLIFFHFFIEHYTV